MVATDPIERQGSHARTQSLLHGPIVSTLFRLSWPNILVMLAQAGSGRHRRSAKGRHLTRQPGDLPDDRLVLTWAGIE